VDAHLKNCKYLEDRITELMTEKEDQNVHLKSQIIIFKQKAKGYKTKLQVELEDFKRNSLLHEKQHSLMEIQKQTVELNDLRNKLKLKEEANSELQDRINKSKELHRETEVQLREELESKEEQVN